MTLPRVVRRALALPPGEALRKAQRLARMRSAEVRYWLADLVGGEPLAEARAARAFGLADSRSPQALVDGLFGPQSVLPLAWSVAAADAAAVPAAQLRAAVVSQAEDVLAHRFDLLGSGAMRVSYTLIAPGLEGHAYALQPGAAAAARQVARMAQLLPGSVPDGYQPIDWHVDFRSGYRWDPGMWYRRIPHGHLPGVDIKLPWELSRLQHAGALGLAWRLAADSPAGAAAPAEFRAQVVDWLAANPVRRGVNWACTMDVALRALSWLVGLALLQDAPGLTRDFRWLLARALQVHGDHVAGNLEYDPVHAGNHYLADLVGLVAIAAAVPEIRAADGWLAFALHELVSEAERQILPDGGHIEGSTAYHAFVLEMFLTATAIARRLPAQRRERVRRLGAGPNLHGGRRRPLQLGTPDLADPDVFPPGYYDRLGWMAGLSAALTAQDGLLPQVGDHDGGRVLKLVPAQDPRDWRQVLALAGVLLGDRALARAGDPYLLNGLLLRGGAATGAAESTAGRPPSDGGAPSCSASQPAPEASRQVGSAAEGAGTLSLFPRAGLAVGRAGPLQLLASFARVPRNGTGGHHHNDLLSFELSYRGLPLVVDGGTWVYTSLPERRDEFRRTDAHSTIAVGGQEQRRWPPRDVTVFLVTRDADVMLRDAEPGRLELSCAYGSVSHLRRWRWTESRVEIVDEVTTDAAAAFLLNLAPGVTVEDIRRLEEDDVALNLVAGAVRASLRLAGVSGVDVIDGVYSIGYGRRVANRALVARLARGYCQAVFELGGQGEQGEAS